MNMPLVLLNRRRRGGAFSPTRLFALAEPGVWYDPSDLTTLFQDTAGTTPVTTPGQTVGLVLDKSQGAVGTNGASRRNLLTFTEQFDNAAWTKTAATVTANAGVAPDGTSTADLLVVTTATSTHAVDDSVLWQATSGTSYTVSVFVKKPASNSARYFQMTFGSGFFGATQYATYDLDTGTVSGSAVGTASISDQGNGWFRCVFTAPATGSGAGEVFFSLSNAATGRLPSYTGNGTDSILIWGAQLETGSTATNYQRITTDWSSTMAGFHATQATAASRPTYALHPSSGIRNLANGSADVGNTAFWPASSTQNGITATKIASGLDTDGLPYVDVRYQGTASSTFHTTAYSGDQSRTASATGVAWATSFVARVISGTVTGVSGLRASVREETSPSTFVGISDGNAITSSTDTTSTATRTLSTGNQASALVSLNFTNGATIDVTYRIKALQFERGSTRTAYQFNYAITNIVEAPFAQLGNLLFDGIDDFLVTPTITPGIDKAQVFAGVRKLSDAAAGAIAELSVSRSTNAGSFGLYASSGAAANYLFLSRGSVDPAVSNPATTFASPISNVLTGVGDIAADTNTLRVNAAQFTTSVSDQGTGNFLAYPLYIGRRGGTSLPFNGRLYGLVVRFGPNLDAATIAATEAWMNSKTGAY